MALSTRHLQRCNLCDPDEGISISCDEDFDKIVPPAKPSTTFLDALSDEKSSLSCFLFVGGMMRVAITPAKEGWMQQFTTHFALSQQTAVWIIYEWGSPKAYGNKVGNAAVDRAFGFLIAVALSCNVIMTLIDALCWIHSLSHNSRHDD
ncbi:hypothetical protein ACHAWF_011702 [Thalassiosira exigua]